MEYSFGNNSNHLYSSGQKNVSRNSSNWKPTRLNTTSQQFNSLGKVYSRKRLKRRGNSPKVFPYKVCVTEDKVAKDLFHLQISQPSKFQRRQRTISEIENSLTVDSDSEDEARCDQVKISEQFQEEFDQFRKTLMENNCQNISPPRPEVSKALVLWKPSVFPLKSSVEDDDDNDKSEADSPDIKSSMEVQFPDNCCPSNKVTAARGTPSIMSSNLPTYQYDDDLMEL